MDNGPHDLPASRHYLQASISGIAYGCAKHYFAYSITPQSSVTIQAVRKSTTGRICIALGLRKSRPLSATT